MAITIVNVTRYQNPDVAVTGTFSLSAPAAPGNLLVVAVIAPAADATWDPYPPGLTSDVDGPLTQSGVNLLPVFPINDPDNFGWMGGTIASADLWYIVTAGATSISWASGGNPSFWVYEIHSDTGLTWVIDAVTGSGNQQTGGGAAVVGPPMTNADGQEIFFQVIAPSSQNLLSAPGPWTLDTGLFVDGIHHNTAGLAYFVGSGNQSAPAYTVGGTGIDGYTIVAVSFARGALPCQLAVAPSSLSFSASAGGSNPAAQNVAVSNVGAGGSVPFNFSGSQPWITPNSGSGATPDTVTVGVDIAGLAAGVYTGILQFTSSCGSPSVSVSVTLTVAASNCVPENVPPDALPPTPPASAPCAPSNSVGAYVTDLKLFIGPATALYSSIVGEAGIQTYESTAQGRSEIVLDFDQAGGLYARDLGTIFSWPMTARTVLYTWQPSVIPLPENIYGRPTDWDDAGITGTKMIQGCIIEADSMNAAKTFYLQSSDDLSLHSLLENPATFNGQSVKSFSCVPFFSHSVRVVSQDGVPWRLFSEKLVFQPFPELNFNWQTEMTSLGRTGWAHAREINIAHMSTDDLVVVLTFDAWPTITLGILNSGGVQHKTKLTLPPNKWKLMGFQIYSCAPFRLFEADVEVKIKTWGTLGEYEVLKPFGGPSRTGAIV